MHAGKLRQEINKIRRRSEADLWPHTAAPHDMSRTVRTACADLASLNRNTNQFQHDNYHIDRTVVEAGPLQCVSEAEMAALTEAGRMHHAIAKA